MIDAALERGHELTLFNRGTTGADLYPDLERMWATATAASTGSAAARGTRWSTPPATPPARRRERCPPGGRRRPLHLRVEHLGLRVVLGDRGRGIAAGGAHRARPEDVGRDYGALKALCERAVEDALPGRAASIRAGLIVGPHDPTGRFTYWPHRIARGGDVLVPGPAERPIQLIDVRDLAAWIVTVAEERPAGAFNATGPDHGRRGRRVASRRRLVGPPGGSGRRVPRRAGGRRVDGAASLGRHAQRRVAPLPRGRRLRATAPPA